VQIIKIPIKFEEIKYFSKLAFKSIIIVNLKIVGHVLPYWTILSENSKIGRNVF